MLPTFHLPKSPQWPDITGEWRSVQNDKSYNGENHTSYTLTHTHTHINIHTHTHTHTLTHTGLGGIRRSSLSGLARSFSGQDKKRPSFWFVEATFDKSPYLHID